MSVTDNGWTLVEWDIATGRTVWSFFNGQETVFRIDEPVDALVEQNTFTRNATSGNKFGDWVKVASVPVNHAHHSNLVRAHHEGDDTFVKRWLNDGDNRAWRSFEGNI